MSLSSNLKSLLQRLKEKKPKDLSSSPPEETYELPYNLFEYDRTHQQHFLLRNTLKGLYLSPIKDRLRSGIRVLDVGCGPGAWTREMAIAYPQSTFHGIDCAAVFPEHLDLPNLSFSIHSIHSTSFPDHHFDFTFQRLLYLGLSTEDWDHALNELYRITSPGGYVELLEPVMNDIKNAGPLLTDVLQTFQTMMTDHGLAPSIYSQLESKVTKAGFVHQRITLIDHHLNHTDACGDLFWKIFKKDIKNLQYALSKVRPEWQDDECFHALLEGIAQETRENLTCPQFFVCYAQKPHALK